MMTDVELAIHFFLQLLVVIVVCRLVGLLGRKLGQTQVVSEMIAGVLLGPSLFGAIWFSGQQWLFPKTMEIAGETVKHPSMSILYVVSQLALVLYMFQVGLEFDLKLMKSRGGSAFLVSASGIVVPILLGGAAGFLLHGRSDCFQPNVQVMSAAFFVGASMSITAFPMLARIIYEAGIARTSMGTLALGAAAFDDGIAWCLLAIVLSSVKGDPSFAAKAIGGGALFAILMFGVASKALVRLEKWREKVGFLDSNMVIWSCSLLLAGASFTDSIGIYAVFGAFIVGASFPKGKLSEDLQKMIGLLVTALLLPTFFVYSGLNTKIGLISTWELIGITALLTIIAIIAKGVACTLAAKAAGEPWPEASKIGVLMNSRGLIELIILNIGLEKGVITPTFFTMMVIMAIVTTVMASPIFQWLQRKYPTPVVA